MAIGYLGDIVFEVNDKKVLSFKDFKQSASGNWGEHKRIGQKSEWEFLGANSQKITCTIVLDSTYGVKPLDFIKQFITYAESGTTHVLVIGNERIGEMWRVTDVSASWNHIMNLGELVKATLSITLEETNEAKMEVISTQSTGQEENTDSSSGNESSTTYVVVKGDNLWDLANRFYGDGSKYTIIYNANKDKIQNPSLIYPGQELIIPVA